MIFITEEEIINESYLKIHLNKEIVYERLIKYNKRNYIFKSGNPIFIYNIFGYQ